MFMPAPTEARRILSPVLISCLGSSRGSSRGNSRGNWWLWVSGACVGWSARLPLLSRLTLLTLLTLLALFTLLTLLTPFTETQSRILGFSVFVKSYVFVVTKPLLYRNKIGNVEVLL